MAAQKAAYNSWGKGMNVFWCLTALAVAVTEFKRRAAAANADRARVRLGTA